MEPGRENTIPINAEANVINNPKGHALNSARYPYFIATNLCPSSCTKDPIATPIITIGKMEMKVLTFDWALDIAKEMLSMMNAIIKSLISFFVNVNIILFLKFIIKKYFDVTHFLKFLSNLLTNFYELVDILTNF